MNAQFHYPKHLQGTAAPYLEAISPEYLSEIAPTADRVPTTFQYQISTTIRRKHCNPPIWTDTHYHNFQITLHLQAVRGVSAMYGIDMIEVEMLLKAWAEALPEVVNDHPLCTGGTTEDLCLYFARIELDPHIQLLRVDVAETPERITSLPIFKTASPN